MTSSVCDVVNVCVDVMSNSDDNSAQPHAPVARLRRGRRASTSNDAARLPPPPPDDANSDMERCGRQQWRRCVPVRRTATGPRWWWHDGSQSAAARDRNRAPAPAARNVRGGSRPLRGCLLRGTRYATQPRQSGLGKQ